MTDVIAPLVARHASDAAFYWLRLDQSAGSFQFTPSHFRRFNDRLDAHLEGLSVAGAEGIRPALAALERWQKSGEAFVCTWLAGQYPDGELQETLESCLERMPDSLLRGASRPGRHPWQRDRLVSHAGNPAPGSVDAISCLAGTARPP